MYNGRVSIETVTKFFNRIYTFRSSEEQGQEPIMLENLTTVIKLLFLLNIMIVSDSYYYHTGGLSHVFIESMFPAVDAHALIRIHDADRRF